MEGPIDKQISSAGYFLVLSSTYTRIRTAHVNPYLFFFGQDSIIRQLLHYPAPDILNMLIVSEYRLQA